MDDLPFAPDTFSGGACDIPREEVVALIAQGQRTVDALHASRGAIGNEDFEIAARISNIENQMRAGEAYLEICFAAQAEPGSARIDPPQVAPQPAAAPSFAGNWTGRFSGPIGTGGCQTTESGTLTFRLNQASPGGPVSGTASYSGNIVPRNCGSTSLGGADNCASANIAATTPNGNTLRFQLTCNGETETVNLTLDSPNAASGTKAGRSGQVSWDMTFNLTK